MISSMTPLRRRKGRGMSRRDSVEIVGKRTVTAGLIKAWIKRR
jgi:hypothetical protein